MAAPTKILIVEDGLVSEQMATFSLQMLGNVEVDSIDNGEDALQLVATKQYDIIFMDIGLPGMDGIQVTKKIRKSELQKGYGSPVPIVALTAKTDPTFATLCVKAGMNGFLHKPLTTDKAKEVLNEHLGEQPA